jgi:hypothetical protein
VRGGKRRGGKRIVGKRREEKREEERREIYCCLFKVQFPVLAASIAQAG